MLEDAKTEYHRAQIADCNSKQLFRTIDKLCGFKANSTLPSGDAQNIADDFGDYFSGKITKLRSELDGLQASALVTREQLCTSKLSEYQKLTQEDIRKLIMDMPSKSCPLDTLPTWLLKNCIEELLPAITKIITRSNKDMYLTV